MEWIYNFFNIQTTAFTLIGYDISWIELIGTIFGFWCVYLTAKENILCWPIGIINIIFFFILFYQIQLYSDMLLQIIFFIMSLYGWWKWTHPSQKKFANAKEELKISDLSARNFVFWIGISLAAMIGLGFFMTRIHQILPVWFSEPAAYPFPDAFTTVFSLSAQMIMALKKRQCWLFWIVVDIVACTLYFMKGIYLVGIEYIVFGIIAFFGYRNWTNESQKYNTQAAAA